MTSLEKAQVIAKYLSPLDCSSYRIMTDFGMVYDENFMQFESGNNEGCYITLGGYVFRLHSNAHSKAVMQAYVNAIQLYLTLV
jgi:hypothetical protein